MTQEDRKLLLQDLCARLPYGVKIKLGDYDYQVCGYNSEKPLPLKIWYYYRNSSKSLIDVYLEDYHPYLRHMTSMTEEEFEKLKEYSGLKYEQLDLASYQNGTYKCLDFYLSEVPSYVVILVFDWLNAHHFDYRGLIEKGLAIAVTEENNPYKE